MVIAGNSEHDRHEEVMDFVNGRCGGGRATYRALNRTLDENRDLLKSQFPNYEEIIYDAMPTDLPLPVLEELISITWR